MKIKLPTWQNPRQAVGCARGPFRGAVASRFGEASGKSEPCRPRTGHLRRKVMGLLNKLSERNRVSVASQLAELPVQTAEAGDDQVSRYIGL